MNHVKTVALLALLGGLFIVVGGAIAGKGGMIVGLVIAVVMNVGTYWYSDRIILSMYRAQPVTESQAPDLYRLVRQLADRAELPMPKVYIIPDPSPNAFATGRNPDNAVVAVTEGILRILTWEELAGVIGHELGHIKNRDILIQTIAATIGAAITYLAYFGMFFGGSSDDEEGGGGIIGMLLMVLLAPIAASLIQMAISRRREYLADEAGARICGQPMYLANALNKLERGVQQVPMHAKEATEPLFIVHPFAGGIGKLFSTHPPIPERIRRLQQMTVRG